MKKILVLAAFAFFLINANAEKKTVNFTVEPALVCHNCEVKVKDNLRFEKGVKAVKPSAEKGIVEVTFDDKKTDVSHLKEGFRKIGYEATPVEEGPEVCPEPTSAPCCNSKK